MAGAKQNGADKPHLISPRVRRDQVLIWLVKGVTHGEIIRRSAKKLGASRTTAQRDIRYCRDEMIPKLYTAQEHSAAVAEQVAKAEHLYMLSIEAAQYRAALLCLKWIGELKGLRASQQIAAQRDTLRTKLEEMRRARESKTGEGKARAGQLELEVFNEMRSCYGLPAMTPERFAAYKQDRLEIN